MCVCVCVCVSGGDIMLHAFRIEYRVTNIHIEDKMGKVVRFYKVVLFSSLLPFLLLLLSPYNINNIRKNIIRHL